VGPCHLFLAPVPSGPGQPGPRGRRTCFRPPGAGIRLASVHPEFPVGRSSETRRSDCGPVRQCSIQPAAGRAALRLLLLALALALGGGLLGAAPAHAGAGFDTLYGSGNETLYGAQNQSLFLSPTRNYEARMQGDGNFVVYGPSGPVWSSNTRGSNARLVMQSDGNLVMYGSSAVWASQNAGERAIQWFYNNMGRTDLEGQCEKAVELSFGYLNPHYNRAIDDWYARAQRQPYTDGPRGSLVFYNTSSAGHVAVSLGAGKVASTSASGGRIGISPIGYFQNRLGWAYAPW
jgi:cell wall-associated NlpC family hydrolase